MIQFFVPGTPVCKQSFRYREGGGYTPAHVRAWQEAVGIYALAARVRCNWWKTVEPVKVELDFYLPDKRKRDADNLSKAILDSIKGVLFDDDAQVVDLHIRKYFVTRGNSREAGVRVTVEEMGG